MNNTNIFSNDPNQLIRLGNNQDTCYICKHELLNELKDKYMDRTEKWQKVFELEGKEEYKPMLKIRYNGLDICICEKHLNSLSKEITKISKELKIEEKESKDNKEDTNDKEK